MGQAIQAHDHCTHRSGMTGPASRPANQVRDSGGQGATDGPVFQGIHTLIVEDSEIDRKVAVAIAGKLGLRVEAVASADRAINLLREVDDSDPFDLVLMDFKMPDLDGLATSQYIKNELKLVHRPRIILLSAYRKEDIFSSQSDQFCIDGFLTKPMGSGVLAEMISDLEDTARGQGRHWRSHREVDALLSHTHVLLAEDNLINQKVAKGILNRRGMAVTIAGNGQQALDLLTASHPDTFQLVVMDIDMPIIDGYQATVRIKNHPDYAHIPIVALTAQTSTQERERCLNAGMSAYLTKPVKPELFYDTLLSCLLSAL